MLTLLCTLVFLVVACWLVLVLGLGLLFAWFHLLDAFATVRDACLEIGGRYLYPEWTIPLLLGVGPFVLLAVMIFR